jgi:predicted O-linked N-acetylglucosamine transferase (SPINDLY family)
MQRAALFHQKGQSAEAAQLCLSILAAVPDFHPARHLLGLARARQGRHQEALEALDLAAQAAPTSVPVLKGRAEVLERLGRAEEALATLEQATALTPDDAALWNRQGLVLRNLSRSQEALARFDRAIQLRPGEPLLAFNRGMALVALERSDEALVAFDRAGQQGREPTEVLLSRGLALLRLDRPAEALASLDAALAREPLSLDGLINRGNALWRLGRRQEALACFTAALEKEPDNLPILNNQCVLLTELGRGVEALVGLNRALTVKPDDLESLLNRGLAWCAIRRFSEALTDFTTALAASPDNRVALAGQAITAAYLCDFDVQETLRDRIAAPEGLPLPLLVLLGYTGDAERLFNEASADVRRSVVASAARPAAHQHKRLRLAYLSPDFRRHPVAQQIVEVLERHDRSRFEVTGIALRPSDASDIRARMERACDHFHDFSAESDHKVAEMLRAAEIDIAVDLAGHTEGSRLGIFAHRPAPVQVSWLGYAGTTGANFIDYVIGDAVALPMTLQPFFSERIVHLPHSFWASDTTSPLGPPPSRAAAGLPDHGLVLAGFNRFNKIHRPVFASWMRIMAAVPNSVLWLPGGEDEAAANLRREAKRSGIDADRLIVAAKLPSYQDHLARLSLADLFLDTVPYNAHASASDALWAGVPVITVQGDSFAGRVAASLLSALGLEELVTENIPAYEALALDLARDPARRSSLARRLAENRRIMPLFDMGRRVSDLERAYLRMHQQGSSPEAFALRDEA